MLITCIHAQTLTIMLNQIRPMNTLYETPRAVDSESVTRRAAWWIIRCRALKHLQLFDKYCGIPATTHKSFSCRRNNSKAGDKTSDPLFQKVHDMMSLHRALVTTLSTISTVYGRCWQGSLFQSISGTILISCTMQRKSQ